jgi:putative heme-binding domain-containing protein
MRQIILSFALVAFCCQPLLAESAAGFRIQPGFEITEFSGSNLANDIHCMTIDPKGRIIVSGPGYIRILVDEKYQGKATRAIEFATPKEGAQGLLWEGDSLLAVVDGGLWRYREMADGKAAKPELLRKLKTGGEHDCHAIRRGSDGWLYLIGGNNSKFDKSFASLSTSPIKEPIAGCLVRFSPDYKDSEILADGFRNPYCFDISPDGDIFTFDSDNERCVSLPWYEPTRLYHVIPGRNHGWMSPQYGSFWRRPPYFFDVSPPLLTLGRGSPTGVVYYDRKEFPAANRGLHLLDWTFGRVYFVKLKSAWTTYIGQAKTFLESTGSNGFAPTAAAIHPITGDLYVSIGGRGTRGAVYRIRYTGKLSAEDEVKATEPSPVVDPRWKDEYKTLLPKMAHAQGALTGTQLCALIELFRHHAHFGDEELLPIIREHWDSYYAFVRPAVADLISVLTPKRQNDLALHANTLAQRLTVGFGVVSRNPELARLLAVMPPEIPNEDRPELNLDLIRLIQKSIGDIGDRKYFGHVWEGYVPRGALPADRYPEVRNRLQGMLNGHDSIVHREVARTLGMLRENSELFVFRLLLRISADTDPVEDIHNLIVLSRLPRDHLVEDVVPRILSLDNKLAARKLNRDSNWTMRMVETVSELGRMDPSVLKGICDKMDLATPEHIIYTRCPGFDKTRLAKKMVAAWEKGSPIAWTPEHVAVLAELAPTENRPILRQLWDRGGLEDAILQVLACGPDAVDHDRFLHGLTSPKLSLIRTCLGALDKLPAKDDGATLLAFIRGMRMLPDGTEADALRPMFAAALKKRTQQEFGPDKANWTAWFERTYPELAKKLGGADGVDVAAWQKRLAGIDWSKAEAQRGKAVIQKAGCINCHSGSQAMGPDLAGVGSRFSRDDLFTAIIQPSKDISPRYRTTQIETTDGKTYQGLIVYEAVDGVILQTGPAETVRIDGKKIESRRLTDTSLMPVGLIDKLTDMEIADLYAYLRAK